METRIPEAIAVEKNLVVYPWRRFWARRIDGFILFCFLILATNINPYLAEISSDFGIFAWLFVFGIFILIESIVLSIVGTTPGKWIFNLSLRSKNGGKVDFFSAIIRTVKVYVFGLGLEIPIINAITMMVSCSKLNRYKETSWDRDGGLIMNYGKINFIRILISIISMIIFVVIFSDLYPRG